jgi:Uma2 family endonuclease
LEKLKPAAMLVTHPVKRYTYTDYKNLDVDDNFLYELINGELVQKSAPSPRHQDILMNLIRHLDGFVFSKKLGKVLCAPVDVFVDEHNVPQPDLLFVNNEHRGYITPDGLFGPPDLVVEIVSPSSITRDRVDKMRIYRNFGIPEYWIVDPRYASIEIFYLTGKEYELYSVAVEKGAVQSKVLEGLVVNMDDMFAQQN